MTSVVLSLPFNWGPVSGVVFCPSSATSPRRRTSNSGPARAEKRSEDRGSSSPNAGEDDAWRRASLTELEIEFGIKPKETKVQQEQPEGSRRPRRTLSREEWQEINKKWEELERDVLGMDPTKDNKLAQTLQRWGQWLIDRTKETDDADPRYVATGLLVAFSLWFVLLLVTARAIQLPFQLPFLEY